MQSLRKRMLYRKKVQTKTTHTQKNKKNKRGPWISRALTHTNKMRQKLANETMMEQNSSINIFSSNKYSYFSCCIRLSPNFRNSLSDRMVRTQVTSNIPKQNQ